VYSRPPSPPAREDIPNPTRIEWIFVGAILYTWGLRVYRTLHSSTPFCLLALGGYENGQGQTEAAVRRCHLICCSWCLPHPLAYRLCRKIFQRFNPSHFYDDLLLSRGLIRGRQPRCPIVSVELFHHTFTPTAAVLMSEKTYSLSFSVLWLCLFQQIQSVQLFPLLCVALIG
jgi:hypothetical protein